MRFLFLEPFFGGSHRDVALGLQGASRHEIDLATLPARFWKWRMRGAALHFLKQVKSLEPYDGIIASGLMSLADFKALYPGPVPRTLLYMHENQLTYPLAPGERMDYHFGFTDITSALAADRVLFNSRTHREAYFAALPRFIRKLPEFRPTWTVRAIEKKSGVLYPGCRFPAEMKVEKRDFSRPPLIIWNHRWEFDKAPEVFFNALYRVLEQGAEFRLALLGENFQVMPKPFIEARERLGDRIIQYGYVEKKEDYLDFLHQGHVAVSTADQENFGISMVEAMRFGCLPLLPDRLSYPEILPAEFHGDFLYDGGDALADKLFSLLTRPERFEDKREALARAMVRYSWDNLIGEWDKEMETLP